MQQIFAPMIRFVMANAKIDIADRWSFRSKLVIQVIPA